MVVVYNNDNKIKVFLYLFIDMKYRPVLFASSAIEWQAGPVSIGHGEWDK
jgi:hypothetical protein